MPTLDFATIASGNGGTISGRVTRRATGGTVRSVELPAGKAGTLTTRTDNETGTLTLGVSHGITTAQVIDLYWDAGARYGITVGTVAGTSVPIGADNSGTGDNLPTQGTSIVAAPLTTVLLRIDPVNLVALSMKSSVLSRVRFNLDSMELGDMTLEASALLVFDIAGGDAGPYPGSEFADRLLISNSSAAAATFDVVALAD